MELFKKEHIFEAEFNGVLHNITFYRKNGKYYLNIDGELKETFKPFSFLAVLFDDINDYEFDFSGTRLTLAVRYGTTRLAVNGIYTDTGGEFTAVRPLPVWAAVFVAAILLPPFYFRVQMLDVIIAVLFAYMCTHFILKNPDIKASTGMRAVYCSLVTVVSWLSLWVFNFM